MSAGNWDGGDVLRHMACTRLCAFGYERRGVRQMLGKEFGEVERN